MDHTIFHIDVNSAYLSWEAVYRMKYLGEERDLREIPSAVGGDRSERHGIVLAKSIPAKKYGVRTAEPITDALRKCPELVLIPANHKLYSSYSKKFFNILADYSPLIEKYSIDEAFMDVTGDTLFPDEPVKLAAFIKDRIRDELGFTVNVGISDAKILAKMASDFKKPDMVHTLYRSEIADKMWGLPVEDLFFVGKSTAGKLRMLGIRTIGELAGCDINVLKAHFGKMAVSMHESANGIDDTPVNAERAESKGYSNSTTMNHDVTDAAEARSILLGLSENVGARLRADDALAGVIAVTIKNNRLVSMSHQVTLTSPTAVTTEIYDNACRLFGEMWKGDPIRLLGVSASHISKEENRQMSLFDMHDYLKHEKLEKAIDTIRTKYGSDIIKRAALLHPKKAKSEDGEEQ